MSVPAIELESGTGFIAVEGASGAILLEGAGNLFVPNVIGKYYYDAQLALLQAGFLIDLPTWVLPGTFALPGLAFTADSSITADSSVTVDSMVGGGSISSSIPGIVVTQSLPPGTQVQQQTLVKISAVGFLVIMQPNTIVAVP